MAEISNLKEKAFKGVFWSYINKFGTQIIAIIPGMILARLISPEEYGVVAMAAVFSGLAYVLVDGGFGTALFQKKDADHLDCCTVFYFNIGICSLVYTLFFLIAPYCAAFFNMPEVTGIMRVSLLGLITNAFGSIHGLLFRKRLEFRKPAIRNIVVQIISATVAIVMALTGCGYWALVIQGLLQTTCGSIANWLMCDWRPTLTFSLGRLKDMFGFGSKMFITILIDYGFNKGYDTTIGKFYSATSLSYYNRAMSTAGIFVDTILGVLHNISLPIFIQIQDDKHRTIINMERVLKILCLLIFSLLFVLIALAQPLFNFMYSSKWDDVIPLFQIVCIVSLLRPLQVVLEDVLLAYGNSTIFIFNSLLGKIMTIIIILITWRWGIIFMLLGQSLGTFLQISYLSHFTNKYYAYSLLKFCKMCFPYFLLALALGGIVSFVDHTLLNSIKSSEFLSSLYRLLLGGATAFMSFIIINKSIKLDGFSDLLNLIEDGIKNETVSRIIKLIR